MSCLFLPVFLSKQSSVLFSGFVLNIKVNTVGLKAKGRGICNKSLVSVILGKKESGGKKEIGESQSFTDNVKKQKTHANRARIEYENNKTRLRFCQYDSKILSSSPLYAELVCDEPGAQ